MKQAIIMVDFAYQEPLTDPLSVEDVKTFEAKGPWRTKSGGELAVLFALGNDFVEEVFRYEAEELENVPEDIRGLRAYTVTGLAQGSPIAGREFHRIRKEVFVCLKGGMDARIEDVYGNIRMFKLDPKT